MKPKTYPTVLVTGAAGQLGQEVLLLLRAHGYHVLGTDLLPSPTTDLLLDVRDADAVLAATRSVDAIIHTAALHGKHTNLGVPRLEFVRTNIEGTLNLLNACREHGIRKLLYTSTTSIYGQAMEDARRAVWVTEELTPQPRDIYDITKFEPADAVHLKRNAAGLIQQRLPAVAATYQQLGWQLPASIDRVYSSEKATRVLGYQPHYTFQHLLSEATHR